MMNTQKRDRSATGHEGMSCASAVLGVLFALCIFLLGVESAWTQVPTSVSFAARLTDLSNNTLDGTYNITFSIYDAPTFGTLLWSETQSGVPVINGALQTKLGSITPIPYAVANTPTAYLQIQVGSDVLSPRQPLLSVLYAYTAYSASSLSGLVPEAFVTTGTVQAISGEKTFAGGIVMTSPLTLAGSTLTVTGNAFSVNGADLVLSGGQVGIGTASPGGKLQVVGGDVLVGAPAIRDTSGNEDILVRGNLVLDGGLYQAASATASFGTLGVSTRMAVGELFKVGGGTLTVLESGNVGIGTSAPATALVVIGTATANGFVGSGAGLSGVMATSLAPSYVIPPGNLTNTILLRDTLQAGATFFVSSGTVNDLRIGNAIFLPPSSIADSALSANVALLNTPQTITGTKTYASSITVTASAFSVGGSTLAVKAGNVGIGTASPATALVVIGTATADGFVGNGAGLSGVTLDASYVIPPGNLSNAILLQDTLQAGATFFVSSGTVNDLRVGNALFLPPASIADSALSANVALLSAPQTITGAKTHASSITVTASAFSVGGSTLAVKAGNVGIGTASPVLLLDVAGDVRIGTGVSVSTMSSGNMNLPGNVTAAAFYGDGTTLTGIVSNPFTSKLIINSTPSIGTALRPGIIIDTHTYVAGPLVTGNGQFRNSSVLNLRGHYDSDTSPSTLDAPYDFGIVNVLENDNPVTARLSFQDNAGLQMLSLKNNYSIHVGTGVSISTFTGGNLTVPGKVTAGYFYGDGTTLTGIVTNPMASKLNFSVSPALGVTGQPAITIDTHVYVGGITPPPNNSYTSSSELRLRGYSDEGGGDTNAPFDFRIQNILTARSPAAYRFSIQNNTGTEHLVVKDSGEVGIGTTAPTAGTRLHIAGTVKIVDGTQANGKVLTSDANGLASWQSSGAGGSALVTATQTFTGQNTFTSSAAFTSSNAAVPGVTISSGLIVGAGNVGIGTTEPNKRLHLLAANSGAESILLKMQNSATAPNTATAVLFSQTDTTGDIYGAKIASRRGSGMNEYGDLGFYTNGDGTLNERLTIQHAGNVGIGTTVPGALLSVGSGNQFQVDSSGNLVKVNNLTYSWPSSHGVNGNVLTNNGSGTLSWTASTPSQWTTNAGNIYYTGNVGISTGAPQNALDINGGVLVRSSMTILAPDTEAYALKVATGTGAASQTLVFVSTNGNVGIGMTNPGAKLDVQGGLTVNGGITSSGLTVNGGITASGLSVSGSFSLSNPAGSVQVNDTLDVSYGLNLTGTLNQNSALTIGGASGLVTVSTGMQVNGSMNVTGKIVGDGSGLTGIVHTSNDEAIGGYKTFTSSLTVQATDFSVGGTNLIAKAGKVGIGVDPTAPLHVSGHIHSAGTAPTITADNCGITTQGTVTGSDVAGVITTGGSNPSTCVLTFASAWASAPICVVSHNLLGAITLAVTPAASTLTINGTTGISTGTKIQYICIGQ